jgi:hypothetical protein
VASSVVTMVDAAAVQGSQVDGHGAYSITSGTRQWNAQPGSTTNLAASAGGVLYLDQGLALNTGTGANMATRGRATRRARSQWGMDGLPL